MNRKFVVLKLSKLLKFSFLFTFLCFLISCKSEKGNRPSVEVPKRGDNSDKKTSEISQNTNTSVTSDPLLKQFEGKLVEVVNNNAISVQMNYASNKIFCMPPKVPGQEVSCLIKEPLYKNNRCFVKKELKDKLQAAAIMLQKQKAGFKIVMLDCYRPISVQKKMYEKVSNPTWVAAPNPPKYGGHNRAVAVDVTLQDASGKILDMGSLFDEFSQRSVYSSNVGGLAAANRKLLREVFVSAGMKPYDNEWWHFSIDVASEPLDIAL